MDHFRVSLRVYFKRSLGEKPSMWKWVWSEWKLIYRRNTFSHEWLLTETRFDIDSKAKCNIRKWLILPLLSARCNESYTNLFQTLINSFKMFWIHSPTMKEENRIKCGKMCDVELESSHLAVRLSSRTGRVITTHSSSDKKYSEQNQVRPSPHFAFVLDCSRSRWAILKTSVK